jgi:hypothetical protein
MESWQQVMSDMLDTLFQEAEQRVYEVSDTINEWAKTAETVAAEIYQTMNWVFEPPTPSDEIDERWMEWWIQDLDELFETTQAFHASSDFYNVEMMRQPPIACRGCHHFHGQIYGGNALICGMHPYGPDTTQCSDWEGIRL